MPKFGNPVSAGLVPTWLGDRFEPLLHQTTKLHDYRFGNPLERAYMPVAPRLWHDAVRMSRERPGTTRPLLERDRRAFHLLWRWLYIEPRSFDWFVEFGTLVVLTKAERLYEITQSVIVLHDLDRSRETHYCKRPWMTFCLDFEEERLPVFDHMLACWLLLRTDEEEFLRRANVESIKAPTSLEVELISKRRSERVFPALRALIAEQEAGLYPAGRIIR